MRVPSSSQRRPRNTAMVATMMARSCPVIHSSPSVISWRDSAVSRICPVLPNTSAAAPWIT